ncbi:MAG: transposase [Planctomycetaceae bacterium]|nr:transposase [Planctomycetaceae bacterium]
MVTGLSMPDTPELAKHFGYPANQRPGCGFPVAHLLGLFDAASGLCRQVLATPMATQDLPQMPALFGVFQREDVLVADRGSCSGAHLACLLKRGLSAVFRGHASQRIDSTPGRPHRRRTHHAAPRGTPRLPASQWVQALGSDDQLVRWFKPPERPRWLSREESAALPDALLLRELRYAVRVPGFRTLSITLLDPVAFPKDALAELYQWRWRIEGHFRELKTTLRLEPLKCRRVDGVLKELTMLALVYNLVRAVMREAARQRGVPVEQISFTDTWRWLQANSPLPLSQLVVNPHRPHRSEPRAIKRRPKPYPLLTQSRRSLNQRPPQPL